MGPLHSRRNSHAQSVALPLQRSGWQPVFLNWSVTLDVIMRTRDTLREVSVAMVMLVLKDMVRPVPTALIFGIPLRGAGSCVVIWALFSMRLADNVFMNRKD